MSCVSASDDGASAFSCSGADSLTDSAGICNSGAVPSALPSADLAAPVFAVPFASVSEDSGAVPLDFSGAADASPALLSTGFAASDFAMSCVSASDDGASAFSCSGADSLTDSAGICNSGAVSLDVSAEASSVAGVTGLEVSARSVSGMAFSCTLSGFSPSSKARADSSGRSHAKVAMGSISPVFAFFTASVPMSLPFSGGIIMVLDAISLSSPQA